MTYIKNIELISSLITQEDLATLEAGASVHFQMYKIEYKILEVDARNVTIRITQVAIPIDEFLSSKQMASVVKGLFQRFLPNLKIHARPIAYSPPKTNKVNASWVNYMLAAKGITFDAIQEETGLDRKKLHDWLSGKEPMSQEVKAMFWYMLR